MHYHHLWTSNPDGTAPMVFFGNQHPGTVMIDARPIPDTPKVVAIFSPDHGQKSTTATITVVDPHRGPDALDAARRITKEASYRDPWAFSEDLFLAAQGKRECPGGYGKGEDAGKGIGAQAPRKRRQDSSAMSHAR